MKKFLMQVAATVVGLATYDYLKRNWANTWTYKWECDTCGHKVRANNSEDGADLAMQHIKEQHQIGFD